MFGPRRSRWRRPSAAGNIRVAAPHRPPSRSSPRARTRRANLLRTPGASGASLGHWPESARPVPCRKAVAGREPALGAGLGLAACPPPQAREETAPSGQEVLFTTGCSTAAFIGFVDHRGRRARPTRRTQGSRTVRRHRLRRPGRRLAGWRAPPHAHAHSFRRGRREGARWRAYRFFFWDGAEHDVRGFEIVMPFTMVIAGLLRKSPHRCNQLGANQQGRNYAWGTNVRVFLADPPTLPHASGGRTSKEASGSETSTREGRGGLRGVRGGDSEYGCSNRGRRTAPHGDAPAEQVLRPPPRRMEAAPTHGWTRDAFRGRGLGPRASVRIRHRARAEKRGWFRGRGSVGNCARRFPPDLDRRSTAACGARTAPSLSRPGLALRSVRSGRGRPGPGTTRVLGQPRGVAGDVAQARHEARRGCAEWNRRGRGSAWDPRFLAGFPPGAMALTRARIGGRPIALRPADYSAQLAGRRRKTGSASCSRRFPYLAHANLKRGQLRTGVLTARARTRGPVGRIVARRSTRAGGDVARRRRRCGSFMIDGSRRTPSGRSRTTRSRLAAAGGAPTRRCCLATRGRIGGRGARATRPLKSPGLHESSPSGVLLGAPGRSRTVDDQAGPG